MHIWVQLLIALSIFFVGLNANSCSYLSEDGEYYDLSPLTRSGAQRDWTTSVGLGSDKATFYVNFCAPTRIQCSSPLQGVCLQEGLRYYSIGSSTSYQFTPMNGTQGISLTYSTSPTKCSLSQQEYSVIDIVCDETIEGEIGNVRHTGCEYRIQFRSIHGCPKGGSPPPPPPNTPVNIRNLPGVLSNIGYGFDVFTLTPKSHVIFNDYTYKKNFTWIHNNNTWGTPDQISVAKGKEFGVTSRVYRSVKDFQSGIGKNFGLELQGKVPHTKHLVVGGSLSLSSLNSEMESLKGVLWEASESLPIYSLSLLPVNSSSYSAQFQQDVMSLPTSFNPQSTTAFDNFYAKYGTHIQIGVEMGGRASYIGVAGEKDRATKSEVDVKLEFHLSYLKLSRGAQGEFGYVGINRDIGDPFGSKSVSLIGGDSSIKLNEPDGYSSWIRSIPKEPAAIDYQLLGLYNIMKDISSQRAEAYYDYLSAFYESFYEEFVENKANPVYLTRGPLKHTTNTNCKSPLVGIPLWMSPDDDDCFTGYWYTYSNEFSYNLINSDILPVTWQKIGTLPLNKNKIDELQESMKPNSRDDFVGVNNILALNPDGQKVVPGISSLGVGIDGATGKHRLPVFEFTYKQQYKWWNPKTNENYVYPDQVFFRSQSFTQTNKATHYSYQSFLESQTFSDSTGWDGKFLFKDCSEYNGIEQLFEGAQSILGVAEELQGIYQTSVTEMVPSLLFNESVSRLPLNYTKEDYFEFLLFWGTHVITEASYGGKATMWTSIDQTYFFQHSETDMEHQLGVSIGDWSAGYQWGIDQQSTTIEFRESSLQWITFTGGFGVDALTREWDQWRTSVYDNPAQIYKSVNLISNFISNPTIKANVERAISEYLSDMAKVQAPVDPHMSLVCVSSNSSNQSLIYSSAGTPCVFEHDFANENIEKLVVDVNWSKYKFQTAYGYYKPGPMTMEEENIYYYTNHPTPNYLSCPTDNTWISWIGSSTPPDTFECKSTSVCYDHLLYGSNIACSFICYTIE